MTVQLFCPHCTRTETAAPLEGEHLFATKARIRKAMGETCPRNVGLERCPMRERTTAVPTLEDFERA